MPVRFVAAPSERELRLGGDGAVATLIPSPNAGVAPWLPVRSRVRDAPFRMPLHELRPDEKLVGFATDVSEAASDLFPGSTVIPVTLDPTRPLPGAPAAWQALDAVIMNPAAAATVPEVDRTILVAGGTTLAVRAENASPPGPNEPWKLQGGFWVLHSPSNFSAVENDDAYEPAAGWRPGRSAAYRRQVVLLATAFAILFVAAALWRGKGMGVPWGSLVAAAILSGVAVAAFQYWNSRQTPVATAVGAVHEVGITPAGVDTWLFERSPKATAARLRWSGLILPVLPRHGGAEGMTLVCDAAGNPVEFRYSLSADRPLAFVSKSIATKQDVSGAANPVTSPLRMLVGGMYPGMRIVGEMQAEERGRDGVTRWPTVVVERRERAR